MNTSHENATAQQRAIGEQAVDAVLCRVAGAVEASLPGCAPDLVLSGQYERMHRLEGLGDDEPVYLRVTAHWLTTAEARRLFPDDTDSKVAALKAEARAKADPGMVELLEQRYEAEALQAKAFCEAEAHVGLGRGTCGQPLDSRGQCGRANMHTGS